MGISDTIKNAVRDARSSRSVFDASVHRFAIESADRVARKLDLVDEAEERGRREEPPSDQDRYDQVEDKILQFVGSQHATNRQTFEAERRAYDQRRANVDLIGEARSARLVAREASATFKNSLAMASLEIDRAHEYEREAADALSAFRRKNDLSDPAHDPNLMTSFGLLFFLVVLEAFLNGFLFAGANVFGLLGGAVIAGFISLFNVVLAACAGFFAFREVNHVRTIRRVAGWFFGLAAIGLLVAANLLAAHYRDVVVGAPAGVEGVVAFARFMASPFGIEDYMSWLLFGLGIIASLLSMWKGYGLSDPYPGYLKKTRAYQEARDDLQQSREDYLVGLKASREKASSNLETLKSRLREGRQELSTVITASHQLCNEFEAYEAQLELLARSLLSTYRDKNRASRSTPTPSHFSDSYELKRTPTGAYIPEDVSDDIDEAIANASDHLDEAIATIFTEYDQKVSAYEIRDGLSS